MTPGWQRKMFPYNPSRDGSPPLRTRSAPTVRPGAAAQQWPPKFVTVVDSTGVYGITEQEFRARTSSTPTTRTLSQRLYPRMKSIT